MKFKINQNFLLTTIYYCFYITKANSQTAIKPKMTELAIDRVQYATTITITVAIKSGAFPETENA